MQSNSASARSLTRNGWASPSNSARVDKTPPRQLADIFAKVTDARQNQTRVLDDAHSYENGVTNSADAQAAAILSEAQSARTRYVQSVQADANVFSNVLPNYLINPRLFEQQKLVQVMGDSADQRGFQGLFADHVPMANRLN